MSDDGGAPGLPRAPAWLPIVALRLAFASGLVMIVAAAFQWALADLVTPFGMAALAMAVWPLMLVSLVLSGLSYVLNRRPSGGRVLAPLAVNLATIGLTALVPWTWLDLEARWMIGRPARERAVAMVRTGAIGHGQVLLPRELRAASTGGGEVVVGEVPGDSLSVLFYTYRGILDHWSGYLYVSRDTAPTTMGVDSLFQVVARAPHWYFVASK